MAAPRMAPMSIDVEHWYRKYGPMVLRRCRKLLRDEEKSLDAMQEVFVRVLRYEHRLRAQYPSSLLYRMATNVCLNIIRDEKQPQSMESMGILDKIACYDESEDRLIIQNLLEKIFVNEKNSTRGMAVMLFIDGMTLKEVAGEFGMSVSGVRKRIRRLRTRIQNEEVGRG